MNFTLQQFCTKYYCFSIDFCCNVYRCVNLLRGYFVHLIFGGRLFKQGKHFSIFNAYFIFYFIKIWQSFMKKNTDCTFYKLTPIFLEEHILRMSPPFIKRVNLLLNWKALTYREEKLGSKVCVLSLTNPVILRQYFNMSGSCFSLANQESFY